MMVKSREDVAEFALLGGGIADSVGGKERKVERARYVDGGLVAGFFLAMEVALEFNINVGMAEDADEPFDTAASFIETAAGESVSKWSFVASGEADEPGSMFAQFVFEHGTLAFVSAQFHLGVEATEVLVSEAGGDKKRKMR